MSAACWRYYDFRFRHFRRNLRGNTCDGTYCRVSEVIQFEGHLYRRHLLTASAAVHKRDIFCKRIGRHVSFLYALEDLKDLKHPLPRLIATASPVIRQLQNGKKQMTQTEIVACDPTIESFGSNVVPLMDFPGFISDLRKLNLLDALEKIWPGTKHWVDMW